MRHDEHYVDQITSRAVAPPVQLIAVTEIDGARPLGRRELDPLVESIAAVGVVQPLLVRRHNGRYHLISGSRRLAAAVAAGLTDVPCLLQEADDERARVLARAANLRFEREAAAEAGAASDAGLPPRAAREIIDSLTAIASCLNLFVDRERPLRERVAASLARAEAQRARWLVEAHSLLSGNRPAARKPISPAVLIERTLKDFEAERRLANVELALTIDEPTGTLVADEHLMIVALSGTVSALLGVLHGAVGATLKVRVGAHPATRLLAFQFSQDLVAAPEITMPASDDGSLPDWAGRHGASLRIAVARRVIQLHGGRVEVVAGPRSGCTITLLLPAGD
jgi:ParB/RepB/Spo0J family partition protein